jgi:hypothetical protein
VVSSTQITATFAIATTAALGAVNISVTSSGMTTNAVTFTIGPPFTVTATVPTNGADGVPINQVLSATFGPASTSVNCATIITTGTAPTFTLKGPAGAVAVTLTSCGPTPAPGSGSTATFTPTSPLASNASYSATLTTAVQDSLGDPLLSNYVWSFATAPVPTVISTIPTSGATAVPVNQILSATFSEAMNCATISTSSFTLTGPGGAVVGTVACSGTNATFTPGSLLASNTMYTATITTGVTNVGGGALASNYVWSFTTVSAPTVISTVPINGATGVPNNQVLTATFSQVMQCSTITTSSFTLTGPGGAVAGTVACSGTSASFTPTSLLASLATYTATITTAATNNVGDATLASNYVWSFTTELAPTVTSTNPTNLATGVPVNQVLTATFSEPMQCSTITASSFTLAGLGGSVAGIVACAGTSATFTPTSLLTGNTPYTATITTGATNVAGAPLTSNYVWHFTIVGGLTVTLTIPPNGATGVPINQAVSAAFSQPVNCATITALTFTLTGPGGAVTGAYTCPTPSTATFTPSANLAINTNYIATITTGVTESAAPFTALAIPYVWTFRTGATPNTTPPTVTAITPLNLATGVGFNTAIVAMFDEAMDSTTMNGSTFTLASGCAPSGALVGGGVTYNPINNIITLTPTSPLAPLTCFTVTVTTGAKNLADVPMAANFVWTFTTGAAPDLTAPTVISTIPLNLATNVPLNQAVTATFSKAMLDTTINTTTFTLAQGGTPVLGVVSYVAGSDTAIFTPNSNLAISTLYTATITTGASDLSGNFMVSPYVWTFTTAAPLLTAPTVLSTNPVSNAVGVCTNAINATFSTAMNAATINTGTFLVTTAGNPVLGTISMDVTNTIATFTPLANLAPSTTYTVTITTGVEDLALTPLAVADTWSFTTGTAAACAPVVPVVVPLGVATPFGGIGGGAGMTNQGSLTVINGDIGTTGASSTMTGFHDTTEPYIAYSQGCIYSESGYTGKVNGEIFTHGPTLPTVASCPNEGTAATAAVADQAAADALTAYNALAAMPSNFGCPGSGNGAGKTLPPGVYTCASTFGISLGDLTLDAGGNANAVWVFQIGSALTVGTASVASNVILINGAQPQNVFWQVATAGVINYGGGGTMVGTIIANVGGITISSPGVAAITTLNGRALSLSHSVTMVNTHINVPGQ